jgi:hypothetical protein
MDGVITKPVNRGALLQAIAAVLETPRKRAEKGILLQETT